MPLSHGKSPIAFRDNVKTEMQHGKPQDQALAIAYSVKKRANKMASGGMAHCAHGGPAYCNVGCYADGGEVMMDNGKTIEENYHAIGAGRNDRSGVTDEDWQPGGDDQELLQRARADRITDLGPKRGMADANKYAGGGLLDKYSEHEHEMDKKREKHKYGNMPSYEGTYSAEGIPYGGVNTSGEEEEEAMAEGGMVGMMHPKRMASMIMKRPMKMAEGGMIPDAWKAGERYEMHEEPMDPGAEDESMPLDHASESDERFTAEEASEDPNQFGWEDEDSNQEKDFLTRVMMRKRR